MSNLTVDQTLAIVKAYAPSEISTQQLQTMLSALGHHFSIAELELIKPTDLPQIQAKPGSFFNILEERVGAAGAERRRWAGFGR